MNGSSRHLPTASEAATYRDAGGVVTLARRMPIRPANTVKIIERRLAQAEAADRIEPMELVSLHDELARVERKWLAQFAQGSERRKPGDREKLKGWYRRLAALIERTLRGVPADDPAARVLRETLLKCSASRGAS